MIKKIVSLVLLFTAMVQLSAQEEALDSLRQQLKVHTQKDTTRVSMLIDYTKYFQSREVDSMLPLIEEAISISREIDYTIGEGYSTNALVTYYLLKGNIDEAMTTALKAKKILESTDDTDNLIFNNNLLARIYVQDDQPEEALQMHLDNIKMVEDKPASDQKAGFYYYVAVSYEVLEDFSNAEKYYEEALNISTEANFETGKTIASSALGNLYNQRGDYARALPSLKKALEFYRKYDQSFNIANAQFAMAYSYSGLEDYREAILRNEEAISIYESQDRKASLVSARRNQADYYDKLGDFKNANDQIKKYHTLKDSIFSAEKVNLIEDLQTKYETGKITAAKEKAEADTIFAEAQSVRNRNYLIGALLIMALIGIVGLLYFARIRSKKKAEVITIELRETQKRLALEKQYRDSELKALKAQMNPHFIFNALNSIQEYIILNKKNLAGDYLGKFADLMRMYLHYSDKGAITIQEEIDCLQMYLELEALRFEDTLSYKVGVDDAIRKELTQIPTMLIQPYVENALKHGLLHKKDNRKLTVSFQKKKEKSVLCIIEDNGIGRARAESIKQQSLKLHASFATKATESRLHLLNFGKNKKIGVEIEDLFDENNTATGTRVLLTIPTERL